MKQSSKRSNIRWYCKFVNNLDNDSKANRTMKSETFLQTNWNNIKQISKQFFLDYNFTWLLESIKNYRSAHTAKNWFRRHTPCYKQILNYTRHRFRQEFYFHFRQIYSYIISMIRFENHLCGSYHLNHLCYTFFVKNILRFNNRKSIYLLFRIFVAHFFFFFLRNSFPEIVFFEYFLSAFEVSTSLFFFLIINIASYLYTHV